MIRLEGYLDTLNIFWMTTIGGIDEKVHVVIESLKIFTQSPDSHYII